MLSAEVLKEHDAAEAAAAAPGGGAGRRARRRRPRSPSELSSESHDSIEDWWALALAWVLGAAVATALAALTSLQRELPLGLTPRLQVYLGC